MHVGVGPQVVDWVCVFCVCMCVCVGGVSMRMLGGWCVVRREEEPGVWAGAQGGTGSHRQGSRKPARLTGMCCAPAGHPAQATEAAAAAGASNIPATATAAGQQRAGCHGDLQHTHGLLFRGSSSGSRGGCGGCGGCCWQQ